MRSDSSNEAENSQVLLVGHEDRNLDFSNLYRHIAGIPGFTTRILNKLEIKNLSSTLRRIDFGAYRRTIIDLPFAKAHKAWRRLKSIPGLIHFEMDACQNFLPRSRWRGAFEKFYRALPNATFIVSGYSTAKRFSNIGLTARVIPKGFDGIALRNTHLERDIEIGFIGRLRSNVYQERQQLLDTIASRLPLALLRTSSMVEYRQTLNRIKIFLSADVGLGEYMAKNFEAMACGCLLVAYRQGEGEEEALGFRDMENIVLYRTASEAADKIQTLLNIDGLGQKIAAAGEAHVQARFTHHHIADQLVSIAREAVTDAPSSKPSFLARLFGN